MMYVIKRNGERQEVRFDAILDRITALADGLDKNFIDPAEITKKVADGLEENITTVSLDDLAARVCASMVTIHPDFAILAARIAISNLHKETDPSFTETIKKLHAYVEPNTGLHSPFVSDELLEIVKLHGEEIDSKIDHNKDYEKFDYFGIKTLQRSYLLKFDNEQVERPQHMFMRVALGIHGKDLEAAFETYELMSQKYFTHATPTLFNAGTPKPQMSSCFLLSMNEDSITGIYKTLTDCAQISQSAGGIGLSVHNVRAKGTFIAGSRGHSNGLIPMLRNFNETARYVDQGGGKRKGSIAIYLEPWHADIIDFLALRKNHGTEEMRTRDLFTALWICDEFMRRVEKDQMWTLMCPKQCPGLCEKHGKEFDELYRKYEEEGRGVMQIKARKLWFSIIDSQIETGTPYMLYKDAANQKSNQKNLGTIKSSNLCTEIIQYTDKNEIAVCNLASICLNSFIKEDKTYDYEKLHSVAKTVCRNLNKVIDKNLYVVPEAKNSNLKHRPMGIGVQGLSDTFALMDLPYDSLAARELNRNIFETIYHGAVEASIEIAKKEGAYDSFKGSPTSEGKFQFDLWGVVPDSDLWDWGKTKEDMLKYGLRNSLFIAPMPTASTAQIFGNTESFEPSTSNLYVRRVLSGEFVVINKYLLKDLIKLNLWDDEMRRMLIAKKGSVQNIDKIPEDIKLKYRTVWEIPQKSVIDMAADRGPFICQSMSLNVHMRGATSSKLTSLHFYAWKRGLKTGMYYLRNTPAVDAVAFTVDNKLRNKQEQSPTKETTKISQNSSDDTNTCLSCGS